MNIAGGTKGFRASALALALILAGCEELAPSDGPESEAPPERGPKVGVNTKVVRDDAEWRSCLTPEQYRITRQKGTERAFSGKYWDEKRDGTYICVSCRQPLFSSRTKYKSGSGWPSFWQPVDDDAVDEVADNSLSMRRTEIVCSRCNAHLGHVFKDGPQPTGLRYCMNSAALVLEPVE